MSLKFSKFIVGRGSIDGKTLFEEERIAFCLFYPPCSSQPIKGKYHHTKHTCNPQRLGILILPVILLCTPWNSQRKEVAREAVTGVLGSALTVLFQAGMLSHLVLQHLCLVDRIEAKPQVEGTQTPLACSFRYSLPENTGFFSTSAPTRKTHWGQVCLNYVQTSSPCQREDNQTFMLVKVHTTSFSPALSATKLSGWHHYLFLSLG